LGELLKDMLTRGHPHHLAIGSELDRIVHQIHQNLPESQRVARERRECAGA
jgi:hypothetical protein